MLHVVLFVYINQCPFIFSFFFFNDTATTEIYTLSLHDALPISNRLGISQLSFRHVGDRNAVRRYESAHRISPGAFGFARSEEHTSELQSPCNLVCRLLLEKKKQTTFSLIVLVLTLMPLPYLPLR